MKNIKNIKEKRDYNLNSIISISGAQKSLTEKNASVKDVKDFFKNTDTKGWKNLSEKGKVSNKLKGAGQVAPGVLANIAPGVITALTLKKIQDKKIEKGEDPDKVSRSLPYITGALLSGSLLYNSAKNKNSYDSMRILKDEVVDLPFNVVVSNSRKSRGPGRLVGDFLIRNRKAEEDEYEEEKLAALNIKKKIIDSYKNKKKEVAHKLRTGIDFEWDGQRFKNNVKKEIKSVPKTALNSIVSVGTPLIVSSLIGRNIKKNFEKIEDKERENERREYGYINKTAAYAVRIGIDSNKKPFIIKGKVQNRVNSDKSVRGISGFNPDFVSDYKSVVGKNKTGFVSHKDDFKKTDVAASNLVNTAVGSLARAIGPSLLGIGAGYNVYTMRNNMKKRKEDKENKKELKKRTEKIAEESVLNVSSITKNIQDNLTESTKGKIKKEDVVKPVYKGIKKKKS